MAKRRVVALSATREALGVLGTQIRAARHDRGWTAAELAERIGVSQSTVLAIENGAPLFGTEDRAELARMRRAGEERLALLNSRVYHPRKETPDDRF